MIAIFKNKKYNSDLILKRNFQYCCAYVLEFIYNCIVRVAPTQVDKNAR